MHLGEMLTGNPRTLALLYHLATRPGHDEVKADFRQLLIEEFGAELGTLDFERRVPEVKGRLDALIGRTVFEARGTLTGSGRMSCAGCRTISRTASASKGNDSSASPLTA